MLLRRPGLNTEEEISYLIRIERIHRIVHLRRKSFIIAKMPFYTFNLKGERLVDHPNIQADCYYSGFVEDVPDSDVVLSTCTGLWGHIRIGSLTYEIQPMETSSTFQHLLSLAAPKEHEPCSGVLEDQDESGREDLGRGKAGVPEEDPSASTERPMNDPADAGLRYLEYYVVCDSSVYQWGNRNETRVMLLMLQIISVLHNIYEELGLQIILMGMEMWTERDFPAVSQKRLGKMLERFYNYATFELQRHVHFDHAAIYTRMGEEGSFGMSWGERLCLYNHVSVSVVKTSHSATLSAVSAAHELGHSLGFLHDDSQGSDATGCDCSCTSKPGRCIMYSGVVECHRLSNCSQKAYAELLQKPGKSCLQNVPKELAAKNECGNSIVEGDEECDCGFVQEFEGESTWTSPSSDIRPELQDPAGLVTKKAWASSSNTEFRRLNECRRNGCCLADCKVKPDTDCLYGSCCKECKWAEEGTLCREAATDCDLPEYCTGASSDCPPDVHKQDGEPCGTGDACFVGKCSDLSRHCRAIFGKGAKRAPWSCFKKVNTQGDRTGNCGKGTPGFKTCEAEHVLCGRIQCTNIKRIPVLPTRQGILQTPVGNIWCWGVEFHEGLDAFDIGATPDGSTCGAGKICINRTCIHFGAQDYGCDSSKCNNRGVCNNRQNCHCADGWAPPFCKGKGYGGSLDSGPPPKRKLPLNVIIGCTVGAVYLLISFRLIRKYIITSSDRKGDTELDDALSMPEAEEEEDQLPGEATEKAFQER